MDKAEAKHIKASFQWAVWSVCPSASLSSVERAGQLCGQSRNIKYAAAFPNFGRCDGRGIDLARGMEGNIWGFLSEKWKSICAGGHAALWGLSVLAMYLRGKYEYLINRLRGDTAREPWLHKSKLRTYTHVQYALLLNTGLKCHWHCRFLRI